MKTAVLIPVYNPDIKFPALVRELKSKGYVVVVCNDGSDPKYDSVFDQVKDDVCYVSYEKNKGKGYALKRGFEYIGNNLTDTVSYIVTADADGQHAVEDIDRVSRLLHKSSGIVLGMRDLSEHIPLKSRIGNDLSKTVYTIITGVYLRDNQSGLRGFPISMTDWLQDIPGTKYDYELNVLATAHKEGIPIIGIDIKTIYENNNKNSHFKPIMDTVKIQGSLLSYGLISTLVYTLYVVALSLISWFNIPHFYQWTLAMFIWVTGMHVVLNLFSAGIRHRQKISVIYYVTSAIKYSIATLIILLFDFQGWFIVLGAIIALIVVVILSYVFGRSGIMGKV